MATTLVWVSEVEDEWFAAHCISWEANQAIILPEGTQHQRAIDLRRCKMVQRNAVEYDGIDDLINLQYLDEPNILHNLQVRFFKNSIYTYTGPILIAINPWQILDMYSERSMAAYANKAMSEIAPHLFALADASFRAMSRNSQDQACLISGESGAGKTESTKYIMKYLVFISGATKSEASVEKKILDTNPLLEAFGNARTLRNDNSSRFGKYLNMMFDSSSKICGASLQTYLLEKGRIVSQAEGEANFHIFYQLTYGCVAGGEGFVRELGLRDPGSFKYTCGGVYSNSTDVSSFVNAFRSTLLAMEGVGLSNSVGDVFKVIASVLHLGNTSIVVSSSQSADDAAILVQDEWLMHACRLLQTDPNALQNAICSRTLNTKENNIAIAQSKEAATDSRDALAKALYQRVFLWLANAISDCLQQNAASRVRNRINILDIFGFEHFQVNSFEQFCINYANEKLQQLFNKFVFKVEQEEYTREQIEWSYVDFKDNQECLDLIELTPSGVICLLDEECVVPKGSDAGFVGKLREKLAKHPNFFVPRTSPTAFGVAHYAGQVSYQGESFLIKNKDALQPAIVDLMLASGSAFVRMLFSQDAKDSSSATSVKPGRGRSSLLFKSQASQFKTQLTALMSSIEKCAPHFVRCVNPNGKKQPNFFSTTEVLLQLRCGGVMDAVRVTRQGFPSRMNHNDFLKRFLLLAPHLRSYNPRDTISGVLSFVQISTDLYRVGISKVFFRHQVMEWLESQRALKLRVFVVAIQRVTRGHRGRKLWRKKRAVKRIGWAMKRTAARSKLSRAIIRLIENDRAAGRIPANAPVQYHQPAAPIRPQPQETAAAMNSIELLNIIEMERKLKNEAQLERSQVRIKLDIAEMNVTTYTALIEEQIQIIKKIVSGSIREEAGVIIAKLKAKRDSERSKRLVVDFVNANMMLINSMIEGNSGAGRGAETPSLPMSAAPANPGNSATHVPREDFNRLKEAYREMREQVKQRDASIAELEKQLKQREEHIRSMAHRLADADAILLRHGASSGSSSVVGTGISSSAVSTGISAKHIIESASVHHSPPQARYDDNRQYQQQVHHHHHQAPPPPPSLPQPAWEVPPPPPPLHDSRIVPAAHHPHYHQQQPQQQPPPPAYNNGSVPPSAYSSPSSGMRMGRDPYGNTTPTIRRYH